MKGRGVVRFVASVSAGSLVAARGTVASLATKKGGASDAKAREIQYTYLAKEVVPVL